jgi:hypothetical protein
MENELLSWEDFDKQTIEKIKMMTTQDIQDTLIKYFRVIERTRRGMLKIRGPPKKQKK